MVNVYLVTINVQVQNQKNALIFEKDSLSIELASLIGERDALASEKDALIVERDSLKNEVETLIIERDVARAEVESYIGLNRALIDDNNAMTVERNDLKAEINNLIGERDDARATVSSLLAELNVLREPNVKTIGLEAWEDRTFTPDRLHIRCLLINVGGSPATNVKLEVVAYDAIGALVINATAHEEIGLFPGTHLNVDTYVNYEGQPLSGWKITTVWDTQ